MTPVSRSQRSDGQHSSREPDTDDEPSELDPDDIYHILQTRRRRDVLRYLRTADDPVRLRALAEQIAAWEHETTVENLTSNQRQRVYISLYQSHLPKLDNRGIVTYDKDRGTIESTPLASQFDPYLAGLEDSTETDPWPHRYAGTVGCCGLFLTAVAGDIVSIPWIVASVIVVLLFAALTAVHAYSAQLPSVVS